MADENLTIEAKGDGVWISSLSDELTLAHLTNYLRSKGVRKYDEKAVEKFVQNKSRAPLRIAGRSEFDEESALIAVHVSKDNMSATVLVEPPFFTKPWPTPAEIEEALEKKGVVFGINSDAIVKMTEMKIADEAVELARGQSPKNGENARIELLLDPDKTPEVDHEAEEKIDHRTRSVFLNVHQGDEIAVKHVATPGTDGTSVLGKTIKATPGKDITFPISAGIAVSEDGLHALATIDGRLMRKDNKLMVLPELEVNGDVDFSVGNIDFTGNVKIKGSIREGFRVVAAGSIEVKEVVEAAHVESTNDITISGGIRGMSRGRIIAEGNVTAGFVDQAIIRCRGDLKVKDAIFHSDVSTEQSVTVMGGQKSQIAGGKIQAGLDVICQTLGSEMGTKTEVIVGILPELAERCKELKTAISQHKDNIEKLEANLTFLKKQEAAGTLDEGKRKLLMTTAKSKFQAQSALKSAQEELQELENRLDIGKSKGVVRVKGVCYPGVNITIKGVVYVVKEPFKYAAFVYDDGEVRLRGFDS